MTCEVRTLTPEDWESFAAIRLKALKDNPSVFGSNYAAELNYTKNKWHDWLSQDKGCVFGLCDDQKIIGIIGAETSKDDPEGKTGFICAVYIEPAYRGKGLSRLMYRACIDWGIRYLPWQKLIVSHRADNEASRGAILQQGFVMTHRTSRLFGDGVPFGEICYELDLNQLRKKQ